MIGLYIAFPASAVSSSSLLLHDWLIYLQLGSFQLFQQKLGKIVAICSGLLLIHHFQRLFKIRMIRSYNRQFKHRACQRNASSEA